VTKFVIACLLYLNGFRVKEGALEAIEQKSDSVAKVSFGAAGASWLLSNLFGISLVVHSSGGAILTAGSGYVAGTYHTESLATIV
jgi:hypothetical protein